MTSVYPNKKIKAEEALENSENYIDKAIKKLNRDIQLNLFNLAKNNKNINFKSNYTEKEYHNIIEKAKSYIKKGDIFQVVPSQRFTSEYNLNALALYRSLRRLNPSPFLVNLNFDTFSLFDRIITESIMAITPMTGINVIADIFPITKNK